MNSPAHIDVAVLAVIISGVILLIQLYRWLASFASKAEVGKIELNLNEKLGADASRNAVAFSRIEGQIKEHRSEATVLLERMGEQIGTVLNAMQTNTGKIAGLIEWRELHTAEDREAHAVIGELRDFMAVAADRDKRADRMSAKIYRSRKMRRSDLKKATTKAKPKVKK